jgi:hypothetical protein
MKGVNDSVETMRQLVRGLLRIKVRPYYLFHCDPVTGAGHFRTSIWKGIEIIEGLRGHVSGLGVPTYVVDGLHGAGKIPVMPNYMLSASDDAVILRNYEGMIFKYAPEDKPVEAKPVESQGVSRVLSGDGRPIIPAETPRQARRRGFAAAKILAEGAAVGDRKSGVKDRKSEVGGRGSESSRDAVAPSLPIIDLPLSDVAARGIPQNGGAANEKSAAARTVNGKPAGGQPTNGKPANGKAANGTPSNGKSNGKASNGKSNGNGAAVRIVALRIVDGVPVHADHDLSGPTHYPDTNGDGVKNGSSAVGKRRSAAANGHANGNGHGTSGVAKESAEVHAQLEMAAIKHELLRRPARPTPDSPPRKANGKPARKI